MFEFLLVCSLLVPLSMIVLVKQWEQKPPADRNGLSGYRTNMSRLNQDIWSYAHTYWGRIIFFIGIILAVVWFLYCNLHQKLFKFQDAGSFLGLNPDVNYDTYGYTN